MFLFRNRGEQQIEGVTQKLIAFSRVGAAPPRAQPTL